MSVEELKAIWEGPAQEPPPGVLSDLAHPGGNGGVAIAITSLCATIAGVAFLLRLWSRIVMKQVYIEDALFVSALYQAANVKAKGLYAGFLYEILVMGSKVYHVHTWDVSLYVLMDVIYRSHIMSLLYGLSLMLVKVAILLSWIRLFVPLKQRNAFFWVSHALIWSNVLFYGIGTITEIFQCTPREKIWNPLLIEAGEAGGHCPIDITKHAAASGFINLLSDLIILLLPQRVIWGLNISRKKKIGMSFLFLVGLFATVAAAIRIYYLFKTYDANDMIYYGSDLVLWMGAEIAAGLMIMGFPSLPKVFKSMPGSTSVLSFLRSLSRSRHSNEADSNSRRGLPSWFKPPSKKARQDPMAISITMGDAEHDMEFLTSPDFANRSCTEHSDGSIKKTLVGSDEM
ncbi:hypothetical protein P280DRAFT_482043 [Massarina eburnea CBS 473.64]|uniref:Rhodopsin domain-containing protein n=1 Tax=Massarina eburnea CBS 473.64 TaxID=1395130 RepID=A0A6A6RSY6_9PLEO|nr:hypothetical protein P280DRAFT_482043 [Massarina eburnea CBS 473.64]